MNEVGAITGYIDVAQLVLYVFWIFFFGLVLYLQVEGKREGFPLEGDLPGERVQGFPAMPAPKTFHLFHGGSVTAPHVEKEPPLNATPTAPWAGAPLEPTGDPMLAGVGPGSYALRPDEPDLTTEGDPKIIPLRVATQVSVAEQDSDPRGMQVIGADGAVAGNIVDVWVDTAEMLLRYYEVELPGAAAPAPAPVAAAEPSTAGDDAEVVDAPAPAPAPAAPRATRVLLPVPFTQINGRRGEVRVSSITAAQFANVPQLRNPDQITLLEEERVVAYYGGGYLYAMPDRLEPLL